MRNDYRTLGDIHGNEQDAANAFRDHSILLSDTAHVRPKTFSNIRIQDPNMFLCAENAMNVQARESVCHGRKLYRRSVIIQHKVFKFYFCNLSLQSSNRWAHTWTNQTVPYGTVPLGVTLFQALRARLRSHRPPGHFATASC